MLKKIKENKLFQFLLIGGGTYLLWLFVYYILIKGYTDWDNKLNYIIGAGSVEFLSWINYSAVLEIDSDHVIISLPDSNYRGVWVGDNCNGFKLFSIFSIFILAYPANWLSKTWFVPIGIVIIHIANVIRIMALVLINDTNPTYLDFNHDYTFTIFVYAVIFGLWYWWLKKFSSINEK